MGKPSAAWKQYFSKFMYLFAIVSQIWLLLQLIEVFRTKNTAGLSIAAFALLAAGHIIWIIYGAFVMEPRNNVMILSSSIALALASLILVGIFVYG